jgi:hypothetical protein
MVFHFLQRDRGLRIGAMGCQAGFDQCFVGCGQGQIFQLQEFDKYCPTFRVSVKIGNSLMISAALMAGI